MKENTDDLIRVMALHALAYCERLFYLEEVEEIHLADASVYAGRTVHEDPIQPIQMPINRTPTGTFTMGVDTDLSPGG